MKRIVFNKINYIYRTIFNQGITELNEKTTQMEKDVRKIIWLFGGPLLFFLIQIFFHPEGLTNNGVAVFATTVWMAIWWIAEVVPIAVTALLPIALFPLSGGLELEPTTAAYGHRFIFLFMGSFMIAIAIEKWNLHKRIALHIIKLIGTRISSIILGFMIATAVLSMWISNTAATVMMFPIGLAIIRQFSDSLPIDFQNNTSFGKALMLAIAYSASIGGMATLIGTPPNMIFAGVVFEMYHIEISFAQWITIGLPVATVLLFISWKYLTNFAFRFKGQKLAGGKNEIKKMLHQMGSMQWQEKAVLIVFASTALLWIFRNLLKNIIPGMNDSITALVAGISLFVIPSGIKNQKLITWKDALKMPWGIFLLFGGGMALAQGFKTSGLALWIGTQMSLLQALPFIMLVVLLVASVNFLTEMTSNMATTAMLLPILASIALSIGVNPYALLVAGTLAASCAFMLPVATPPNAIIFGSGLIRIPDMVKTGIWMNIISIIIITLIVYFLLPLLWGFEPGVFPDQFKI